MDQTQPYNPAAATPASLTSPRFRLFPVRSPLLRESRLISITRVTKMFQFTHFSSTGLFYSPGDDRALPLPGCPIRKSPDLRMHAPPRRLSQPATSFIDSWRLGIHRVPLLRLTKKNSISALCLPTLFVSRYYSHYALFKVRRPYRPHAIPAIQKGPELYGACDSLLKVTHTNYVTTVLSVLPFVFKCASR